MTDTPFADRIVSKTIFRPDEFGDNFHSWQNTALGPSHILKQSAFFRTPNKGRKVENLYYVGGSTVPGIGLPMCLIGAELVYKRLAGIKKGGQIKAVEDIS
jgi:phytoene dehydrogenase-like protein